MSQLIQSILLRRTAVALAAAAGLLISAGTQAATVTLQNNATNSCQYTAMSVAPTGEIIVQCTGTVQQGVPGTFSLSQPGDVAPGLTNTVNVFRSGGVSGAVSVVYNVAGTGCTAAGGTMNWADQDGAAKPISVATTVAGSCTIQIASPGGGATIGSPASVSFTVTGGTGGGAVGSCPAGYTAPVDMLTANMPTLGIPLLQMQSSKQVVSIALPPVQAGYNTGQVVFGESAGGAYTPTSVLLEISINKCKGLIDSDITNRCNISSNNSAYNSITYFARAYSIITDSTSASRRGYCWAPEAEGQWYVNARWTYSTCQFGAQKCGFAIQQNIGPY